MRVLVIRSTFVPSEKSFSDGAVDLFLKYYQTKNPEDEIIELNLNDVSAGTISMTSYNFANFCNPEDSFQYIEQLKSVDKVIFATPMTNFNVSAVAKNYLDHIAVPDHTFSYKNSPNGEAKGMLTHLKVQIITSQGAPLGWYPWGNHTRLLSGIWQYLGAQVSEPILIAGTKVGEATTLGRDGYLATFKTMIQMAAEKF
ncbi:FMN-dependent NADH-azoreductase [Candidatus Mycoplasma pogonae]